MNKLINTDGVETPVRPCPYDSAVKQKIVSKAVTAIFNEKWHGFDEEEDKDSLQASLIEHWTDCIDEYDLAKDFERDGWDVDREFVEKLENVCGHVSQALRDEIEVWGAENDIIPPFPIGSMLDIGRITGFYKNRAASYLVLVYGEPEESTTRRIIEFESAVLKKSN